MQTEDIDRRTLVLVERATAAMAEATTAAEACERVSQSVKSSLMECSLDGAEVLIKRITHSSPPVFGVRVKVKHAARKYEASFSVLRKEATDVGDRAYEPGGG